jgi:hypothetical protein
VSPLGTATQTDDGSDLGFRPAAAKLRVPLSTAPANDDLGFRSAASPANDLGFRPAAPQPTTQPIETPQTAAAPKGPTIGPAPEPSMWDRLKSSIANSAIGYAVEERLPKLSGALGIHPTETAANPYAEQHAHEIIAPGAAFPKPGVAKGVAEFAGSLATPENVELLAATGGLGALEPIIGKVGATAIGRLVAVGFTEQMIHDAIQKWPGFKEAWDNKDTGTAQQLATEALLDLVVAHQAFRHAATEPGATPQEKFGATLDRSKAVAPEPAAPRPQLPAAPIITPPPAGAVAVPEKTPMPGYLRPEPEWLAQNRGLPAGPETKALPPAPSEAIERAANVNIAPGEKPIPLPAQTPTRIGPGAEPIPAGPSAEAAALGFRPIRKASAETPAAKPAPSVNELRSQLAEGRLKQNREMLADLRAGKTPAPEQPAVAPSSPEQLAKDAGLVYKGEAVKGSGVHQFEHPDFPGATMAVRAGDLSTPEALGERMQAKLAEKPIVPKPGETASSVEFMRALTDRKPEAGIATPEMLRDLFSGRLPKEAWQRFVAEPVIEKGLGIGEKYLKVREADPEVAGGLHLLDNAPAYFRAKAAQNVHDIIGDLSREQERLFSLMADADSRENLRTNHPDEYRRATNDPAIQQALANYKPIEQELTAARKRVGGTTLDQDYLRRVYEEHVAGIGKEFAPGSAERATTAFDRVVRPQKIGNLSREATAEYHYEHGLHEFGPAFGTKFIGTHLAALRDQIARDFISKATEIAPGAAEPRSITYKGEKYFRPDIAREMREAGQRDVKAYDRYDPNAGVKYPEKGASKFLGPREVVRALNDYGAKPDKGRGPVGRFLQEQTIGFGLGIPHVANILRRVTQSAPLGAANPEAWARAWKVTFDKGLRARGLEGVDDPTFDKLLQHGAITTGEMANLKAYWGGNLNPANWAKTLAGVGHKLIFEPGSFGGIGGIDQRARLFIADLLKSQKPEMSDAEIGKAVNTQLGDYNRANWNDRQKTLSKFVLFPGWDASSIRWVIEHPIKTTVPPALLVWTANQVLHQLGQNRGEDASDISNIHFGDRSIGVTLLRESMGRNLARPLLNFAQSKIRGESTERATAEASRGVAQGAGGVVGTLRPDITAAIDLAMNRSSAFGGKELVSPEDYKEPGRVLPNRALEKQAALILRHAIPALDRMMSSDQEIDFTSFAGSNLGLPNYQDGAEQKLKRNVAEAMEVSTTIAKLAKTKPDAAREFIRDPDNAAYALFRNELERMGSTLKRIDAAKDAVSDAKNLSAAEKSERLDQIAKARENLLRNADGLDALLFKRKQEGREKPLAPTLSKRPVVETNLGR